MDRSDSLGVLILQSHLTHFLGETGKVARAWFGVILAFDRAFVPKKIRVRGLLRSPAMP